LLASSKLMGSYMSGPFNVSHNGAPLTDGAA
jgi:hypothetical protein